MKVETPSVYWQGNSDIIMSIDFLPGHDQNMFVTCGPDSEDRMFVRFWKWEENKQEVAKNIFKLRTEENSHSKVKDKQMDFLGGVDWKPVFLYGDAGHTSPPNVVRFSPKGNFLASGGCDQNILIWDYKERFAGIGKTEKHLKWGVFKNLRGHVSDIVDLAWAGEQYLVSGSIDNSCIVWNVER